MTESVRNKFDPKTIVLAMILTSQLMIVLDLSIMITALPHIHSQLDFSSTGLSWVQNAYALTFGGLLLLGARPGDILGRRRMFIVGLGIFTVGLAGRGLAQTEGWLLTARAMQGIGAAIAAPATLALLTTIFARGSRAHSRDRRLRAVSRGRRQHRPPRRRHAHDLSVLALGPAHQRADRPDADLACPALPPGHRAPVRPLRPHRRDHLDARHDHARLRLRPRGRGRLGRRRHDRLVHRRPRAARRLRAHRAHAPSSRSPAAPVASRERSGAYLTRMLLVASNFSTFFFLTQYMQGALGFSALHAGLAFLPMTITMFAAIRIVPRIIERIGDAWLLIGGMVLAVVGMAWLTPISPATAFFPPIALPLAIFGAGTGLAFGPLTTAGLAGVAPENAGAASGMINVSHQLGGSLGLGMLVTVFAAAAGRQT